MNFLSIWFVYVSLMMVALLVIPTSAGIPGWLIRQGVKQAAKNAAKKAAENAAKKAAKSG